MNKLIIFFLLILFISCNNEDVIEATETDNVFGFTTTEESRKNLGKYADIFTKTNGMMYLRRTKYGTFDVEDGEIFGTYRENSLAESTDGGLYQFGDIKLQFEESIKTYVPTSGIKSTDENLELIKELFGTTNTFSLIKNNEKVIEFEQYVPQNIAVDILNAVAVQGSNTESIERNNFDIEWNRDELNRNGIVAYMWWNGDRTDLSANEQGQGETVNRAIKLDDSGQGKIPGDLFDDIPKHGIVTLFFIRGNVDIKEFDGETYKFWSASQDKHNIILLD